MVGDNVAGRPKVAHVAGRPKVALQDDRRCFACGPDNPHGLQLSFRYADASARCVVSLPERFTGWSTLVHGGIVVTLLDEAMAHAAIAAGIRAVTARMEVRFRKAAPPGSPLVVEGKVEKRRGRVLDLVATVGGEGGPIYAEARGRFLAVE